MTSLDALSPDPDRIAEGEWITVGISPNTFRLKCRGMDAAFRDHLFALRREATRTANRQAAEGAQRYDPDSLPPSMDEACRGKALAQLLQDVDQLTSKGQPVQLEQYRDLMLSGKHPLLTEYVQLAATRVGQFREEEQQDAEGN